MAGYRLRDGLSFCRLGERSLFLDLHADRYFGLSPAIDGAFGKLIDGAGRGPDEDAALMRAQLVVPSAEDELPRPCDFPAPVEMASRLASAPPSRALILAVLARRAFWTFRLRHRPLAANLGALSRRKRSLVAKSIGPMAVARLVEAYQRASLLVSSHDQCLATSMSLMSDLLSLGIRADLALGVKLNPFQAHCWVQLDGTVVSDELDAVRPFTPIHVI